jgi:hypothetical protein
LIIGVLIALLLSYCRRDPAGYDDLTDPGDNNPPPPVVTWTFLLYDDADFPDAYDPLDDFAAKVYSSDYVHMLVLQDTNEKESARIWRISGDHEKDLVYNFNSELNMGHPNTLQAFIEFADSTYRPDRMIVAFYDHGMAWTGACLDMTSDYDHLTMEDIQEALEQTRSVDLILFTAPCNMGHFEGAYELRNLTEVYMGSEATSGYVLWENPMEQICHTLQTEGAITPHALGNRIIGYMESNAPFLSDYGQEIYTMSAVRTDRLDAVKSALDSLCISAFSDTSGFITRLDSVNTSIKAHSQHRMIDMIHFTQRALTLNWPAEMQGRFETLQSCVHEAILAESHGWGQENNYGMTIYFPLRKKVNTHFPLYRDPAYGLDFATESLWDELIQAYLEHSPIISEVSGLRRFPLTDGYNFPEP